MTLASWSFNTVNIFLDENSWPGVNRMPAFSNLTCYRQAVEVYMNLLNCNQR